MQRNNRRDQQGHGFGQRGRTNSPKSPWSSPQKPTSQISGPVESSNSTEFPEVLTKLPMYKAKDTIIGHLRAGRSFRLEAPTGSGKSVVLTMIFALYFRVLMFSQTVLFGVPTREASNKISDWTRSLIADGMSWIGRANSGFKDYDGQTRIALCTHRHVFNQLVRMYKEDKTQLNGKWVIVDEAHEKSIENYLLLAFIRFVRSQNIDLRVIISTATPESTPLLSEMGHLETVAIKTKMHPVEILYEKKIPSKDNEYYELLVQRICDFGIEMKMGESCLVFCSGESQIETLMAMLKKTSFEVMAYYSQLPNEELDEVHKPHHGKRIILATNVAESAITFPNVSRIVDLCLHKVPVMDGRKMHLQETYCSKASLKQRAGRTGRTCPGTVLRFITESMYEDLNEADQSQFETMAKEIPIMEVMGKGLPANTVLMIDDYDYNTTIAGLMKLKLVNEKNQLTPMAKEVIKYPVSLQNAIVLYHTHHHRCDSCKNNNIRCQTCLTDLILMCIAISIHETMGGSSSLYFYPKDKREDKKKTEHFNEFFARFVGYDDLETNLKIFLSMICNAGSCSEKDFRVWANTASMNNKVMMNIRLLFKRLVQQLTNIRFDEVFNKLFSTNDGKFDWTVYADGKLDNICLNRLRTLFYEGYPDIFTDPHVVTLNSGSQFLEVYQQVHIPGLDELLVSRHPFGFKGVVTSHKVSTRDGVSCEIGQIETYRDFAHPSMMMALTMATVTSKNGRSSSYVSWLIAIPKELEERIKEEKRKALEEKQKKEEERRQKEQEEYLKRLQETDAEGAERERKRMEEYAEREKQWAERERLERAERERLERERREQERQEQERQRIATEQWKKKTFEVSDTNYPALGAGPTNGPKGVWGRRK